MKRCLAPECGAEDITLLKRAVSFIVVIRQPCNRRLQQLDRIDVSEHAGRLAPQTSLTEPSPASTIADARWMAPTGLLRLPQKPLDFDCSTLSMLAAGVSVRPRRPQHRPLTLFDRGVRLSP